MNFSENIMKEIYEEFLLKPKGMFFQQDEEKYAELSSKLNKPIDDPGTLAALSTISIFLFRKRNTVSVMKSYVKYTKALLNSLSEQKEIFFPEIQLFLKNIDVSCEPNEFDRAVIQKIDFYTQFLYSIRSPEYSRLKDFFFQVENVSTPLDTLFYGLFYARAMQSKKIIGGIIFSLAVLVLIFIFKRC